MERGKVREIMRTKSVEYRNQPAAQLRIGTG